MQINMLNYYLNVINSEFKNITYNNGNKIN